MWQSLVKDEELQSQPDPFDKDNPAIVAYWAMLEQRLFCEICRDEQLARKNDLFRE